MRKIIFSLLILLGLSSNAWAMRTPIFTSAAPSTSATNYAGFSSTFAATNDNGVRSLIPLDGLIEDFYVSLTVAPGAGKSYAFTIQKNSADTPATCTVSDANTSCSYVGVVSFSAGDTISIKSVPSGTPAATSARIGSVFNSRTGGGSLILSSSNSATPSTASAQSISIQGRLAWGISNMRTYFPTSGTISKLYVLVTTAPGAGGSGKSVTMTLNKNGVGASVTCTVSETATTCSDLSNTISVVQGDYITVTYTPTSTPATSTVVIGVVFTPTIDGESVHTYAYGGASPDNTQNTYANLNPNVLATSTTESSVAITSSNFVAKKLYQSSSATSPGSGKTMAYYLRNNGADTALTCSKTGTSQPTCSDNVNIVSLASGDLFNLKFAPTSTPSTGSVNGVGVVFYQDPNDKIYGGTLYGSTTY